MIKTLHEQGALEHFNGVVYIKQGETTLLKESYGYANRSFLVPNQIHTKFRIASVSKMFTAVAILQLIQEGKLNVHTSIVQLLNLKNTTLSKEITIHHLLTHTSGIADYYDESAGDEAWEKMWQETPIYTMRTLQDYMKLFIALDPISTPGEAFHYNNAGYILLGLAIEKVSGMCYDAYIKQHIFDKLGMKNSGFYSLDEVIPEVAEGYEQMDGKWIRNIYTATPTAASDGGATSTVDDLMLFIEGLRHGLLLNDDMTNKLLTPYVIDEGSNGFRDYVWKYGYANYYLLDEEHHMVRGGHTGEEYGFSSRVYYYPQEDIHIIILGNEGFNAGKLGWAIHDMIIKK